MLTILIRLMASLLKNITSILLYSVSEKRVNHCWPALGFRVKYIFNFLFLIIIKEVAYRVRGVSTLNYCSTQSLPLSLLSVRLRALLVF